MSNIPPNPGVYSKKTKKRPPSIVDPYDVALAKKCPKCYAEPGVWCGPVLDYFNPYQANFITTWMHEVRYE